MYKLPIPYVIDGLRDDYTYYGRAAWMIKDTTDEFSIRRIDPTEINGYFFTYV